MGCIWGGGFGYRLFHFSHFHLFVFLFYLFIYLSSFFLLINSVPFKPFKFLISDPRTFYGKGRCLIRFLNPFFSFFTYPYIAFYSPFFFSLSLLFHLPFPPPNTRRKGGWGCFFNDAFFVAAGEGRGKRVFVSPLFLGHCFFFFYIFNPA